MKKVKLIFSQNKILWTLILLLAFFFRVYDLDLNPVGLSHDDEIQEIMNAKSLALTASHSPGTISGAFSTNQSCLGNCVYGELGSYILIPWMKIFPLDMFWSKIPFAINSVAIVFFAGKVFENLFKNPKIGLLTGLLIAINPWAIHFGRTAYFTSFSYSFYLAAIYFFTKTISYRQNLILGSLFSIIASLFYFGTKPLLIFNIPWGILYNFVRFKKLDFKFVMILIAVLVILISWYSLLLKNSYAGRRVSEIGVNDPSLIKSLTDEQRRISLQIPIARDLFINKYTIQAGIITEKYFGFFNPVFLYLRSAGSTDSYYISNHAYNYSIEFLFLIIGIIGLGSLSPSVGFFLLTLVAISVLPAAIKITGDTIYALRAALAYPIITGISAWGIYFLYSKINKFKRLFIFMLVFIYTLLIANFLVMYWYRSPFEKSIGWYHHKRTISNYIQRLKKVSDKKIIIVTAQPSDTFNTYIFFSGLYNSADKISQINNVIKSRNYEYNGITFIDNCQEISQDDIKYNVIFIEQTVECLLDQKNTYKIANSRDGGGMYNIINETLCTKYSSQKYPYPRTIKDFQVETLSEEKFCQLWITNPDI